MSHAGASQPSQLDLMRRAEALAGRLTAVPEQAVKRNVLYTLVADFLHRLDPQRLQRLLRLVAEGSGGHLERGGETYPTQVETAARELGKELAADDLTPEGYCSLFGWTARLLESGEEAGGSGKQDRGTKRRSPGQGGPRPPRRRPLPGDETPRELPPPARMGSVKAKQADALARIREQLAARENGDPEDES